MRELQVKGFQVTTSGGEYFIYYLPGGRQWAAFDEGGLAFGWASSQGDSELAEFTDFDKEARKIDNMVLNNMGEWVPIREGTQVWDIITSWL